MKSSILILLTQLLVSCASQLTVPRNAGEAIEDNRIQDVKASALRGDYYDAYRLFRHYCAIDVNMVEARKWYTLAYTLGNPSCSETPNKLFGSGK